MNRQLEKLARKCGNTTWAYIKRKYYSYVWSEQFTWNQLINGFGWRSNMVG